MAAKANRNPEERPAPPTLFDGLGETVEKGSRHAISANGHTKARKVTEARAVRENVRAIQDLLWKEALFAVQEVEQFDNEETFQDHLRQHLPQNSLETRTRYAQLLMRWLFPDGIRGLAALVWTNYRDQSLLEETLRFLYLSGEPMVAATVSDALFPITEGAHIPPSYLTNFIRERFGEETPEKSIKRVKSNLRKLGLLAREKGDTLRALAPSATGFLIILHYLFAREESRGVEFRTMVSDPFWKYLGFKSEDQLREILKDSLSNNLIAKYVVADRIESISFRFTFPEFVGRQMRL